MSSNHMTRLLHCTIHRVIFEDHFEATTGLQCNMTTDGHAMVCSYDKQYSTRHESSLPIFEGLSKGRCHWFILHSTWRRVTSHLKMRWTAHDKMRREDKMQWVEAHQWEMSWKLGISCQWEWLMELLVSWSCGCSLTGSFKEKITICPEDLWSLPALWFYA